MNEEDIQNKFVKWSLKAARKDELSVEAARDFLNELLARECSEETLKEYKIRLPISQPTAWRWMQVRRRASNERARGSPASRLRDLCILCVLALSQRARDPLSCVTVQRDFQTFPSNQHMCSSERDALYHCDCTLCVWALAPHALAAD